jgi:hypothetical protein
LMTFVDVTYMMSCVLMMKIDPLDISFPQNSLMDRNTHMRAQR